MINKLVRAGEVWLYSDALLKFAGLVMTLFTAYLLWHLYRGMQWFAAGMGLY